MFFSAFSAVSAVKPDLLTRSNNACDRGLRVRLTAAVGAVGAELAVEQHVGAHAEHAVPRTMTVAERRAGHQPDRGPPVADEERRDRDLQAIEQVRLEKHRDRDAAALHENPPAPAL